MRFLLLIWPFLTLSLAMQRIGGGETTTTVAGDASEVGGDLTSIVGGLASARNKVIR